MNELQAFLRKQALAAARRPYLLQALLGEQPFAYARMRLGFVLVRLLLRTLLHGVEVYFLSHALPWEYFAPLITFRAGASLVSGAFWGALEELRSAVRKLVREQQPHAARRRIEAWLGLSLCVSAFAFAAVWAYLRYAPSVLDQRTFTIFDAYGIACAVRLALELLVRAYHSGIFALRRVYRPLGTILLADVLELGVLLLAWKELGPLAIPLAIVLSGVLEAWLGFHYAKLAYLARKLPLPRMGRAPVALWDVRAGELVSAGKHMLGNATTQLDAWLLLALVRAPQSAAVTLPFSAIYYVFRPLMAAASHWTRTFYFDLQRVASGPFSLLGGRFVRYLSRLALWVPLGLGVVVVAACLLVWPEGASWQLALLLPLLVARSFFALHQLRAFVLGRHTHLFVLTVSVMAAVVALSAVGLGEAQLLVAVTCLLSLALLLVRRTAEAWADPQQLERGVVSLGRLLSSLDRGAPRMYVGALVVDRTTSSTSRVLRALCARFPEARFARHGRTHVLFLTPSEPSEARTGCLVASGGALRAWWISGAPVADARGAVHALVEAHVLPKDLEATLGAPDATSTEHALRSEFAHRFPDGFVLDLRAGSGAADSPGVPSAMLRPLWRELSVLARSGRSPGRRSASLDLALYAPGGRAQLVFCCPRGRPGFSELRRRAENASLQASVFLAAAR